LRDGHCRVLVEPQIIHAATEEKYISFNLVRSGVEVLCSNNGGNDVENNKIKSFLIKRSDFLDSTLPQEIDIPEGVLKLVISVMREYNFSFIEINPYIINKNIGLVCLDLAVELDSVKLHTLPSWVQNHIQGKTISHESEECVKRLDTRTTSTFSLTVLSKDAEIFTLLSGGGASLVVLDSLVENKLQSFVGNYGEYSGAPNRTETKLYTKEILKLLFTSKAKKKVLIIAGGVANFTDVTTTFEGIVDACSDYLDEFTSQSVMVQVRRGGPRQEQGLRHLDNFFKTNNIKADVSDPSVSLSQIAVNVRKYI